MYKLAQQNKVLIQKVSDSRSYLMMLVSSLMEIKKVEQEMKMQLVGNLDEALNDLAMLDEVLEQAQGEK
jgi:hypothetical protein